MEGGRPRLLVQLKHLMESQIHGGSTPLLMKTRCQLFETYAYQPMVYCAPSFSSNSVLHTTWKIGLVLRWSCCTAVHKFPACRSTYVCMFLNLDSHDKYLGEHHDDGPEVWFQNCRRPNQNSNSCIASPFDSAVILYTYLLNERMI